MTNIITQPLTKRIRLLHEDLPNRANRMFDPTSGILFWDDITSPKYYKLYKEMRKKFWVPEETSMSGDYKCWYDGRMSELDKELFQKAIGVLASLDSIASDYDKTVSYYLRDSAINACETFIGAIETIHNESYTYIESSLMEKSKSLETFEIPKTDPYIVKRNSIIMDQFDNFIQNPTVETFVKGQVSMSGLEGLAFTNGFTPFYFFNNQQKMFGSGTIIQQINRDETMHSQFQAMTVRDAASQYPEVNSIGLSEWIYDFFNELVKNEKSYCDVLYVNHPEIDVFRVKQYIEYRANIILDNLGLDKIFTPKKNPMKWIKAFDPDNMNNLKTDFFEDKEANYQRVEDDDAGWNDL